MDKDNPLLLDIFWVLIYSSLIGAFIGSFLADIMQQVGVIQ